MLAHPRSRSTRLTGLVVAFLAIVALPAAPTRAAGGTISFQATLSGKGHDSGSFSFTEKPGPKGIPALKLTFIGCAVVKETGSPATYQLQVRTTGTYFGGKPVKSGVFLTVDNYHPGTSPATYRGIDAGGTFEINGHSYGDGVTPPKSVVQVTDGGHSGTWSDTAAVRNYPAKLTGAIHGFIFTATWHCSKIYHVTSS